MIKRIQYFFTFISAWLLTTVAYAQVPLPDFTPPDSAPSWFTLTPPLTDKSIGYLSQLFGKVGNVLHGTSGELLSQVFNVFNLGILTMAGVFASYTVFKSVLSTAQDGEFMGRQKNSMWIALRTTTGVGILAPVFGGYSSIQVLMMWVVVHGVGFADLAWTQALNYLKAGGTIYHAPQDIETRKLLDKAAYILKAQTCMYASEKDDNKRMRELTESKNKDPDNPNMESLTPAQTHRRYEAFFESKDGVETLNFPGGVGDQYAENACGWLSYPQLEFDAWNLGQIFHRATTLNTLSAAEKSEAKSTSRTIAECNENYNTIRRLIDLSVSRESLIDQVFTRGGSTNRGRVSIDLIEDVGLRHQACLVKLEHNEDRSAKEALNQMRITLAPIARSMVEDKEFSNPSEQTAVEWSRNQVVSALIGAAADFVNITIPERAQVSYMTESFFRDFYSTAVASGWITAGAFYYDLGKMYRELDDIGKINLETGPDLKEDSNYYVNDLNFNKDADEAGHLVTLLSYIDQFYKKGLSVIEEQALSNTFDSGEVLRGANKNFSDQQFAEDVMDIFQDRMLDVRTAWFKNLSDVEGNPLIALQNLGMKNIDIAIGLFLGIIGTFIAFGVIGVFVGPAVVTAFVSLFAPIAFFAITTLFASGAMLGLYIPLIPYLLFVFGAIGWVMLVLESMVAAPLVALGITHPEGHDLMGKSEQALMLMLGVFLRPVLMIIGMLGGIVLSYVAVRMVNYGFYYLSDQLINHSNLTWFFSKAIAILMLELMYVTILIAIINQAYSLIYLVPDKVMRWIGAPDQSLGAPQALGKVQEGTQAGAKQIGEGGQSSSKLAGGTGEAKKAFESDKEKYSGKDKGSDVD